MSRTASHARAGGRGVCGGGFSIALKNRGAPDRAAPVPLQRGLSPAACRTLQNAGVRSFDQDSLTDQERNNGGSGVHSGPPV